MKRIRSLLGALAVFGMIGGYAFATASPAVAATLSVGPGGFATIQAAVDAAAPGDTIIVQPGTYNESVVINKSIKIHGAPNQPNPVVDATGVDPLSGCGDAVTPLDGFCIFSTGPGPIKNVEIDHLTIQNFPGNGIIAFGAVGLNFHDNTATDNDEYGIAAFDSSQIKIVSNTVTGSEEAGIYVGDSPNASVLIRRNDASANALGIFMRDSAHGTVTENTANGNCWGILLLNTDSGGPGEVFDWTLVNNTANDNTLACPPNDEAPPLSGAGIVVWGANHSRLTANTANGNVASDATEATGGIVIKSSAMFGGADPSFLQVDNNSLFGNGPPDLFWDGTGNNIVLYRNHCVSSVPAGNCIP